MAGSTRSRSATVPTEQYDGGEGWETGQRAPSDRYVEVNAQGEAIGKPTSEPKPGAYSRQITAKGDTVTAPMRVALGLDKPDDTDSGAVSTS